MADTIYTWMTTEFVLCLFACVCLSQSGSWTGRQVWGSEISGSDQCLSRLFEHHLCLILGLAVTATKTFFILAEGARGPSPGSTRRELVRSASSTKEKKTLQHM